MLTPVNREQRIAFALENLMTSREEWEATIWTDEKVFVSSVDRQPHVWRQRDQRLHPNHVPLHRSGRISWGWISGTAIGELVDIPTRMNSAEYIRILEDVFLPSVRAIYPVEDMPVIRLVQDNSGVHTSCETQAWFRNHPEIQLINWPARSPHLNLIENVLAQMVRRWESRRKGTVAALVNHAREIWEKLRPDYLPNLIDSIPNRLNQVIDRVRILDGLLMRCFRA
ncbi:transposable element tc3 transposase [Lasius niger]|uniref:Transposable element tc3 transposase n=1 Tax=Lasius niger TaxID=67767 RepID=A0A0J7K2M0_LASNI|nr:transposable element tc3 transposase [Lasius niger]